MLSVSPDFGERYKRSFLCSATESNSCLYYGLPRSLGACDFVNGSCDAGRRDFDSSLLISAEAE